jgi:oligopeptidase B
LWYVRKHPTTLLPYQVWRHRRDAGQSDVLVYEEKDETFYVSVHKTTSQQFVVIYLSSATTSEVLLLNAEMPTPSRSVSCRGVKIMNIASITISTLSICAPTAREELWSLSYHLRDEQQWETLIAPRHDVMLEGFTLFTDWLVVEERQRGLTSLRQINRKTREWWGSPLTIRPM